MHYFGYCLVLLKYHEDRDKCCMVYFDLQHANYVTEKKKNYSYGIMVYGSLHSERPNAILNVICSYIFEFQIHSDI